MSSNEYHRTTLGSGAEAHAAMPRYCYAAGMAGQGLPIFVRAVLRAPGPAAGIRSAPAFT